MRGKPGKIENNCWPGFYLSKKLRKEREKNMLEYNAGTGFYEGTYPDGGMLRVDATVFQEEVQALIKWRRQLHRVTQQPWTPIDEQVATEEATEEARNPEIWLAGTGEIAAEWTERNRNAMVAMLNFKYEKCAAALKKTPNTVTPTEMAAYLKAQTEHRLRPEQIADCRQSLVFCASCDHVSGANPSCDQCCPSPV